MGGWTAKNRGGKKSPSIKQNNMKRIQDIPSEELTTEICMGAVKMDGENLMYVPIKYRTFEICMEAVRQSGWAWGYLPKEYQNEMFFKEAVKQNGLLLGSIPIDYRTVPVCYEAVKQNPDAISFVPKENIEKLYKIGWRSRRESFLERNSLLIFLIVVIMLFLDGEM